VGVGGGVAVRRRLAASLAPTSDATGVRSGS